MNTTSVEHSKFENELLTILSDLSSCSHNKSDVFKDAIKIRLFESLQTYYKELSTAFEYLDYRDEINLMNKYERVMR